MSPRPPMAFRPGDRVRRRERPGGPGLTGEVVGVRWIELPGEPGAWAYETSWGSTYPAHELLPLTPSSH